MRNRVVTAIVAAALALVGTVLLLTHVRGLQARVAADERPVRVLVVQEPIPEGTPAEGLADLVEPVEMPARLAAPGSVASLDQLAGRVTTADLLPGEQLVTGRFADPATTGGEAAVPRGLHQVTISLPAERALGGRLQAGDVVGVFVSLPDANTTKLVLQAVLVTQVQVSGPVVAAAEEDDTGEEPASPVPAGAVLVTLALSPADAERVVFAAEHAAVWLSHQPRDAAAARTSGRTQETIYD